MSEMESHTGTIQQILLLQNETVEDRCRKIVISKGKGIEDFGGYESFERYVINELDGFVIVSNKLYRVIEHQSMGENDISRAIRDKDGNISFALQFYNGGSYFEESLEDAIIELERKEANDKPK